jgi:PAS domain S-box-containing protein
MISVLYVDDEPGLLEIARIFLEASGEFTVTTTTSAENSLELLSTQSFDAIISDYLMPKIDGIAFLKTVREQYDDTPFILFTGRGREEIVIDAINNGADFYLQKGGDPKSQFAELAHKIRQAVRRREAERELRQSEARYRSVVNDQTEMIVRFTTDGTITFTNEAYRLYFVPKLGLDEIAGKNIRDLMQIANYETVENFLGSLTPETPIREMERKVTGSDGETYWQLWSVRAIFDKMGKTGEYQVVGKDISGQKRATAALADSESRLRSFIETTREAVSLIDEKGMVVEWNTATEQISGIKKEEALGRPLWDLTVRMLPHEQRTEDRRAAIEKSLRTMLQTGIPPFEGSCIVEAERPDGTRIFTRQVIFPMRTGKGFRFGSISEDVTREKRSEDAVRESETRFREFADLLPQMVFELDRDFRVTWANQHAFATLGFTSEEIDQGINARSFIVSTDLKTAQEDVTKFLSGMPLGAREFTAVRKDKSSFPALVYSAPVYRNGILCGFRGVAVDISDRKLMEDALRLSEEKFRGIAERSSDLILILNKEMSPVYVSPSVQLMLGFAPEELLGKTPEFAMATIFSETGPALMEAVKATMSGQVVENIELQLSRKDKTPVIVSMFAVPVLRDGILDGVQVSMRDITEQVVTQSALKAIIGSMVGTTGYDSLWKIAENVSSWLGADCVMVGEIQPDDDTVKVLSMILDGKQVNDFIYHLKGTPCENVKEKGFCHYPDDAVRLFPDSKDLVELNIRGYLGTPLKKSEGTVIGILCALFRHPFPSSMAVKEIMEIIATKAGAEIERSQIERALRGSEAKFRSFVENASEIVFSLTPEGLFSYISPNCTELLGYDPGDVIGKPSSVFIHPDDYPRNRELFRQSVRTGKKTRGLEYRVQHNDGSWRWYSQSISPVYNDGGNVIAVNGICHDITNRKLAEAELQNSQYLLSEAMNMAHMADWELDVLTGVFTFNDRFYALYGTTAEREGGYQMPADVYTREFTHPDDRHMVGEEIEKALSTPDSGYFALREHRIIRRDGEVRTIIVRIRVTKDAEGRTIKTHGANQDITDRKKAEEALIQANNKLNLLSGITRHDINNQLMALNGFVSLLKHNVTEASYTGYFSRITEASRNIAEMIEFTKEYEMIGTGARIWQDLTSVINTAGKGIIPEKIQVKNGLDPTTEVFADPMLEKVFFNLIDNAVRHGERVTEIRVSPRQSGKDLVVVWEDNGIGIAADEKEWIFERGFGKNTGLGMFLVREILSLTGITIAETGEPGVGARFEITVPHGSWRITR